MQDLRVIEVEDGALVVSSDDGTRYRIAIDDVLHSTLRQAAPVPGTGPRIAPREVQAHIRAGMSALDVASVTGAPLEYIQKFEGPVLAEREYVIEAALGVPVHTALELDPLAGGATFGSAIRERLVDLGALNERWASWKENGVGWIVKLSFTANQIDHDARWAFDPKKLALDPMNGEAITLSQQGDNVGPLVPRLRAVHADERETNRFDSGAFDLGAAEPPAPSSPYLANTLSSTGEMPEHAPEMNQTADLLEALRRRRGEREAAIFHDDVPGVPSPLHPSTGSIRIVDVPIGGIEDDIAGKRKTAPQPTIVGAPKSGRKGRQAMPSWDEIVFGARPDDDLA